MFQLTFAIITPALIAGAFADRMKFSAMLVFITLWSLAVYCPIAHWVWEPTGWLATKGVLDYAGGTVVHINAGMAGLATAAWSWASARLWPRGPAHNLTHADRRGHAVGGMVWIQCWLGGRRRRARRDGYVGHPGRRRRRLSGCAPNG